MFFSARAVVDQIPVIVSRAPVLSKRAFSSVVAPNGAKNLKLFMAGRNNKGQLGNSTTRDSTTFLPLSLDNQPITSLSLGEKHSAATTIDGRLWIWGCGSHGQLGLGDSRARNVPTVVKPLEGINIVQVVCGRSHTAALSEFGHVYTWGRGGNDLESIVIGPGCLGHGNKQKKTIPTVIEALVPHVVTSISSGDHHMCAITEEGKLFMWGNGEYGRLGFGDSTNVLDPRVLDTIEGVESNLISLGSSHSAAIVNNGQLWTWGRNEQGQCGRSGGDVFSMDPTPLPVSSLQHIKISRVACGTGLTACITQDNQMYMFGARQFFTPTHMTNITEFSPVEVACGKFAVLAVSKSGSLIVYGRNTYGQLGTGDKKSRREPEEISDLGHVRAVACGGGHSAVLVE